MIDSFIHSRIYLDVSVNSFRTKDVEKGERGKIRGEREKEKEKERQKTEMRERDRETERDRQRERQTETEQRTESIINYINQQQGVILVGSEQ